MARASSSPLSAAIPSRTSNKSELTHEKFHQAGNVIDARTRQLDAAYKKAVAEVRPAWQWRFLDRVLTTFAGGILALVLKDFLERWQP